MSDADHVVIGHPQREEACGLARERVAVPARGIAGRFRREHARQSLPVQPGVGGVLEIELPIESRGDDVARCLGKAGCDLKRGRRTERRLVIAADSRGRRLRRRDPGESAGEPGEARVRAALSAADHRFERVARKRQHTGRGDRAEHHRADDGAGRGGLEAHVERVEFAALRAHDVGEAVRVEPAVGERHLLRRGERAAERGDHHGALGTHHSGLDDARGFQELRGDREIDAAGNGQQRQDRPSSAERARRLRPDLDVIRRRAGALRDAGDRRALRRMSCGIGEVDQPFGEHAAAFSAERRDQDRDGTLHVHSTRGCSNPMMAPRTRAATRSRHPGLLMTSPR